MSKRVLMIVTSNDRLGDTGKTTGLWAEELAAPYYSLRDAGVEVEVLSPAGGPVPIDPGSLKPRGENDAVVERFLADQALQALLKSLPQVSEVKDAAAYDAVFFPGGHGTMWDLPNDAGVQRVVEQAWAAGRIVASVCHGAAGLVSAKRADGKPIVFGRKVNSFTDAEEAAVGLRAAMPFLLETRLRELGGDFQGGPDWQPFAVVDGQLITGQNPQSSALVAGHVLDALGMEAAARKAA